MRRIGEKLLNIVYPRHCPVCHRVLKDPESLVCPECINGFRRIEGPVCMKCGRPVAEEAELCRDCAARERVFTAGKSIFIYDEKMKKSMMGYKYQGRREYGDYYAWAMCRLAKRELRLWRPDILVPVPLHKRKQRHRGFNQAEYLAVRIGGRCGIPVAGDVLYKVRSTRSQKKLDAAARLRNLKDAFRAEGELTGLRILLIDDVFTTGATLEAAAACLKEQGADSVYFLTVCSGINEEKNTFHG